MNPEGVLEHLLDLQANIHAATAMEQYYTTQKTKELDDLKEKYISFFQALLKEADKLSQIDTFNYLNRDIRESYLLSDTRKFFSDLNSKVLWLVHHVKSEPQLLTKLMQFADKESQETKRQLAASLVTFYLTDPASSKPKLYELLARMPLFIKELFQKPGFNLDSLFNNKAFVIILMKQFLKTPEARHSVREIFKEVLFKIDFQELENLELDPIKIENKVAAEMRRAQQEKSRSQRSSGSPNKRSSSEFIADMPMFASILSPRRTYKQEILQKESQEEMFEKEMFREQIKSRKSVAVGVPKKISSSTIMSSSAIQTRPSKQSLLQTFREPSKSIKSKIKAESNKTLRANTKQMAKIVQMMIGAICEHMSAVPFHIRTACKILCQEIDEKFENKFTLDRNSIVFEYLFSKWWILSLANPVAYGLLGRNYLTQRSSQVFLDVIKVINKISKGEFFEPDDKLFPMNDIIETEIEVMNDYLKKLIAIQDISEIERENMPSPPFQIRVACLSLKDLRVFYSIVLKNIETFKVINPTCQSIIQAIQYKQEKFGVFSDQKLEEFLTNQPLHIRQSHKYFLFFDFEQHKPKPASKDNQKEPTPVPPMPMLARPTSERQVTGGGSAGQELELVRAQTEGGSIGELSGVVKLADPVFRDKLVKCLDVLLKNANYLGQVRFYEPDPSRITVADVLNFIDEVGSRILQNQRQAIERAEQNYEIKLASLFVRSLLSARGKTETNARVDQLVQELSRKKCQELADVQGKLFATLRQFNSMSLLILHQKRSIMKNVKHLQQINVQQKVESILSKYELDLCVSREKLPDGSRRIVFENPHKCHHMRQKAPITNSLIGFAAPEPQQPRKKTKAHVTKIDEFTDRMASFEQMQQYLEQQDQNYAEIKQRFEEYMGALLDHIKEKHNDNAQETSDLMDEVENYIMSKLYKHIFPKYPTVHDQEISNKVLALQWMLPQHFDIPPEKQQPEMWDLAIRELNKIREAKSPREKLEHLIQSFKIGADCLTLFARKKGDLAGLDDILPVFTFIILKAKVPFLDTNLKYIERFRNKEKLLGEAGFCKTHVQTAISYFLTLKGQSLEMNEKEFERRILEESRDSVMDSMLDNTQNRRKSNIQVFSYRGGGGTPQIASSRLEVVDSSGDEGLISSGGEGQEEDDFELYDERTRSSFD